MKELTIEEKAKRYDEAIERARKLATDLPNGRNDRLYHVWDLESLFPELKESEDERIGKAILNYLSKEYHNEKQLTPRTNEFEEWMRWIEERIKRETEWGEDDENAIEMAIIALNDLYDEDSPDTTYGGYNLPFNKAAEKLKSLKERYAWRPSEEQIKAIRLARSFVVDDFDEHPALSEILVGIEEQLKKLREE